MFAARDEYRLPADSPLLIDDAKGAINIAALQRQRMIEDVKYPHFYENCIGHRRRCRYSAPYHRMTASIRR